MTMLTERPTSFAGYLLKNGPTLGQKAAKALSPLHNHATDALPDFSYVSEMGTNRTPFDAQAHVIAGAAKMLEHVGNGYIIGEMGTGKTLMGMLSIHEHAKGRPYRALIMCPDHLISTWEAEIAETIPGAAIHRFENWKSVIKLFDGGYTKRTTSNGDQQSSLREESISTSFITSEVIQSTPPRNSGKLIRNRKRWTKPIGPEWYIIGRNQSKFEPAKQGIGSPHKSYHLGKLGEQGLITHNNSTSMKVVAHVPMTDCDERPIIDPATGEQKMQTVIDRRVICPSCGMQVLGAKGVPMSVNNINDKMPDCKGHFLVGIPRSYEGKDGKVRYKDGIDRLQGQEEFRKKIGKVVRIGMQDYKVVACNEKLWNFTRKPYKYPPAKIIQKKLKGFFDYLGIDEVHEMKSDESAQSMAAGALMSSVDHVLCLTGTLIGGYAHHLYPLLMRTSPKTIRAEGFEWGGKMDWSQAYGRVDRVVTTRQTYGEVAYSKGQTSMRKARTGKSEEEEYIRPGIMPTLYGNHMMGNSIFITLEELAEELPDMNEYVGGGLMPKESARGQRPGESDEDYREHITNEDMRYSEYENGYFETAVDLDDEEKEEYQRIELDLIAANRELLRTGSLKLMGAMLWTLMDYPDRPYDWKTEHPGLHAIGYYNLPNNKTSENYVGVTTPKDMDREKIQPKERKLIDICLKQKSEGRQSWVYVNMSGAKRDIQGRLAKLLKEAGLKVCVLRSKTATPIERKAWIDENGPKYDVIISNPVLVATGLTLFSKADGGHNFSTLIFYETGYNLFTLRQAARRAWRIGQPFNCRVYYLYYKDTMQHRGMNLMARKMQAAAALEGEFSAEGLVGMSGEDNAQMELAKTLKDSINDDDAARGWTKLKGREKAKKAELAKPKASAIDLTGIPDEAEEAADMLKLVGQTMVDRGVGMDLAAEFKEAARLASDGELDEMMKFRDGDRISFGNDPENSAQGRFKAARAERKARKTRVAVLDATQPTPEAIAAIAERFRPQPQAVRPALAIADTETKPAAFRMPVLSRAQLAAMFANMQDNGMTLEDFN